MLCLPLVLFCLFVFISAGDLLGEDDETSREVVERTRDGYGWRPRDFLGSFLHRNRYLSSLRSKVLVSRQLRISTHFVVFGRTSLLL